MISCHCDCNPLSAYGSITLQIDIVIVGQIPVSASILPLEKTTKAISKRVNA